METNNEETTTTPDPNVFRFSVVLQSIPVEVEGVNGTVKKYLLRELTGDQRDDYLDGLSRRMKTRPEKKGGKDKTSLTSFKGIHTDLLIKGLVEADTLKPVPAHVIAAWPSSQVEALFKKLKEMSGLDVEEEDGEKND